MTIVADSGSTKTTWMVVETGNMIVTEGLNPHFTTDGQYRKRCREVVKALGASEQLFFYGAGCGNAEQRQRVEGLLSQAFGTTQVAVATDMLGACRAVSGDSESLVGILGTGSNACYYDGDKIVSSATSTGYILGDHGSANHAGRIFLQEYLTGLLPKETAEQFRAEYNLDDKEIMEAVYHSEHPNRFLASVAPFVVKHGRDKHFDHILRTNFEQWIYFQILPYINEVKCPTLNLVGGFAKAIEKKIRRYAETTPFEIGMVVADPIKGLRRYHREHNLNIHTT